MVVDLSSYCDEINFFLSQIAYFLIIFLFILRKVRIFVAVIIINS